VGVGRVASAAGELLLAGRADGNGVLHGALAAGVEGAHVEDVDALHLAENLQTLKTGGLLEIGGDGAGGGARAEEVVLALDLCGLMLVSWLLFLCFPTRPRLARGGSGTVATHR